MRKQKIRALALMLTLALLVGVTGMAAFAQDDDITVSLRIEGTEMCLYDGAGLPVSDDVATVADLLASLSGTDGFPDVTLDDGQYGAYIADIGGLAESALGAMSGWNFRVNGESPSVGIGAYELADGDDIVVFFGDPFGALMQYPILDLSLYLTEGIIIFTSEDTIYDEEWNATVEERPVAGATVIWDGQVYTTDDDGVAIVSVSAGLHTVQIERFDEESGVPTVLRFAPDYRVYVSFIDTPDSAWYASAVEYCVMNGLFTGMGGNMFAPDSNMTMAQLAKVLSRIAGVDTTPGDGEQWYDAALSWAAKAGVIPDIEYQPNDNVTREVFIYMFYKTAELDDKNDMTLTMDIAGATDYDDIDELYVDAVAWAVAAGIITGVDSGSLTISPDVAVSRAVVCTMLMRYYV